MSPLPDNLTEDERLLLHLAGEADAAADRAAAERLATNPQAGQELRTAWSSLDRLLTADAAMVNRWSAASGAAAARSVVSAMEAMQAEAPARERRSFRLRVPTWALYPIGAAAAVVLAMVGWWYSVHNDYAMSPLPKPTDPNPAMLVLRGSPDEDLSKLDDGEIAAQFDSMIPDQRFAGGFGGGFFGGGGGGGGGYAGAAVEREFALHDMLETPIQ